MNVDYKRIADISRSYFLTPNIDAKKRFFLDLEKMEEKILEMSKEESGPWSIWAEKAKEILRIERRKIASNKIFVIIIILSLICLITFFAGIFINQTSLSYGALFIPIGIAIFLKFCKKT